MSLSKETLREQALEQMRESAAQLFCVLTCMKENPAYFGAVKYESLRSKAKLKIQIIENLKEQI